MQLAVVALLLWMVYLLVAPTLGFGWIDSWHNEQRALQVVLLCTSTVPFVLLAWLRPDALPGSRRSLWLIAVFVGIGLISALRSPHPLAGFADVALFGLLLAVTALTAAVAANRTEDAARWARYFALVCAAAYVLGVAVRLFAAIEIDRGPDLDVLILGYANPRFPSALHTVLIPFVALTIVERDERRALRVCAAAALVGLWFVNWGLGTRGIWLAYLIAIPATIVLTGWSRARAMTVALVLTSVLGALLFELVRHWSVSSLAGGGTASPPTANLTLTSREVVWDLGLEAIRNHPLLGIGPMQFAAFRSQVGAHPHNWPLQIGAEWGIPAVVILLILIVGLGRRLKQRPAPVNVAACCAVAAGLVLGLVDGNLVMPVSQTAFALAIGMAVVPQRTAGSNKNQTALMRVAASAAVVFAIGLAIFAIDSYPISEADRIQFEQSYPGAWLLPRFWGHGFL